jgi:hypothetical protein
MLPQTEIHSLIFTQDGIPSHFGNFVHRALDIKFCEVMIYLQWISSSEIVSRILFTVIK